MDLFDKQFVYLEWDDVLEGKEVYVADTLPELRSRVGKDDFLCHVEKNSGAYPFVVSEGEVCYAFVYYDPNYECKRAYMQGKKIQYRSVNGNWYDALNPSWDDDVEYRVKPEERWRPFNDIAELKQAWESKWAPLVHPELFEPMIWVRDKERPDITRLITDFNGGSKSVALAGQWHILEALFDDYEFLDGTPCGVKE